MTALIILCTVPIALDAYLALREWDARRFPADRWFSHAKASVGTIEEAF